MAQPNLKIQNPPSDGQTVNAGDTATVAAHQATELTQEYARHYFAEPAKDFFSLAKDYARDKPDVAAMWAFGLGIIVGWKLKP